MLFIFQMNFFERNDVLEFSGNVSTKDLSKGDHPFINISNGTFRKFSLIVNTICTPLLCMLGLFGNAIGLIVLRNDSSALCASFYTYMCALMICHMLDSVMSLCRSVPDIISIYDFYAGNYIGEHIATITTYFDILLCHMSSGIMFVMSLERLIVIVKPFSFRHYWPFLFPRGIICSMGILFAIYLMPFALCFEVSHFTNLSNQTEYCVRIKPDLVDLMERYFYVETIVMYYLGPIAILLVNTAVLIAHKRTLSMEEINMRRSIKVRRQRSKLVLIVLSMMSLYLLMSIPHLFAQTLAIIHPDYSFRGRYKRVYFLFDYTGNLLTYVNTAFDCLIYIFISKQRWSTFKTTFCRCCSDASKEFNNVWTVGS